MSRRALPLTVDVPRPEADRPAWGKVGLIAAAGFAVGILWPRLTHTRIAPNPPNESGAAAVVDLRPAASAPSASAMAASSASSPAAQAPPAQGGRDEGSVTVGAGVILHCRDAREKLEEGCGSLEFDPVAVPRIKALAQCPAAAGVSGKLSIGFDVDFRDKTVKVLLGRSSTLPHAKGEALIRCADKAFDKVSIGEVPHEHRRYTLFYTASFAPGTSPAPPDTAEASSEGRSAGNTVSESPASGTATVSWDVAIVRDTPKTGNIVARVLRGSKVKVMAHQGDWYKVQSGGVEGWVYRGTIGL
jgi:hypothetical protein